MKLLQLCIAVIAALATLPISAADTVRTHNGEAAAMNPSRQAWEESVILSPSGPCTLVGLRIYYLGAAGTDTIRIAGDASEGTVPPTQYCHSYNTLAKIEVEVSAPGWVDVDLRPYNVRLGGYDRVVIQRIQPVGGPSWAMDGSQSGSATSFLYDALTPNPNFFNIPGIYYLASGDYLVDLIVEYDFDERPAPTWADVTTEMGILNADGARLRSALATAADINGDGYDDLIIGSTAYINNAGESFTRTPLGIQASNTVWADIDNDGDLDCFGVFANGTPERKDGLYVNDGDGNLSPAPGNGINNIAPTVTPMFLDYDHDGDLDLFIANGRRTVSGQEVYFQDKLFRNNGNWEFTDVTEESGIAANEPAPYLDCWGASLTDVNNDGWTDIFVATYRLAPDKLYINNQDGTFTESAATTGVIGVPTAQPNYFGHGMGSDWADIDNDGDMDLAVGNLGHPDQRGQFSNPSLIFRNVGSPTQPQFESWFNESKGILDWHGVTFREMNAGMCFADFDQDGLQDLFHPQISYDRFGSGATRPAHFYIQGDDRFVDRGWEMGLFVHGAWTGVRFDFDRDGDLDLLAASAQHEVRLFRNDLVKRGNAVTIKLENDAIVDAPAAGYGSTVRVHAGNNIFMRQLPGTVIGGRCSQMTHDLHVGIGEIPSVDSVVVSWPDGSTTTHTTVATNKVNVLTSSGEAIADMMVAPQLIMPTQHAIGVAMQPMVGVRTSNNSAVIQISTTPDFSAAVITQSDVGESTQLEETLVDGQTYFWRTRYSDGQTPGPWSSTWQFTVGAPAPLAVTVLTPESASANVKLTPTITWEPATFISWQTPEVTYEVQVLNDAQEVVCSEETSGTEWTSCELIPLTDYTVRVRAFTMNSEGSWSQPVAFTTYGTPENIVLTTPEDKATNVSIRPRFEWDEHPWADAGYDIEYGLNEDFTDATLRERSTHRYPLIRALETGRTYYWRVRGKNQAGTGSWSPAFSFTVEGVVSVQEPNPEPPTNAHHYEVFDITGRLVERRTASTLERLDHRGMLFVVWYNDKGLVLRTDVTVQ